MLLAWVSGLLICFSLSGVLSSTSNRRATIDFDDWHCGSENISKQGSYQIVLGGCPSVQFELNHCCVIHDDCYVRQLGQDKCDTDFCNCNTRVLSQTNENGCADEVQMACLVMPLFGMHAYDASVNYTEPEDVPKYRPNWPGLMSPYERMYSSCPTINTTMSSCALLLNNCHQNAKDCAEHLCNCLLDGSKVEEDFKCEASIAEVCAAAVAESNTSWLGPFTVPYPTSLSILVTLSVVCGLVVLHCLVKMWCRGSRDEKNNRYVAVV